MKKITILLMVIALFTKSIGFFRELTLSYVYGASSISDAYLVSMTIPGVIFSFVAAGLSAGYIPMYSQLIQKEGEEKANLFTSNLVNVLLVICTIIVIFGNVFANEIVRIFAVGFEGEIFDLAVSFTRVSLFAIYFSGLIAVFSSFLHMKKSYIVPALFGLPLNIIVILSIILSVYLGKMTLSVGFVLAVASQLVLTVPLLRKMKYKHKFIIDLKDHNLLTMIKRSLPVIVGVSVNQINILVDKTLASLIVVGGISALNYSSKLNGLIQGIVVTTIITVIYPQISRFIAEKKTDDFLKTVSESITLMNILVTPAIVGMVIFSSPMVNAIYGRGSFNLNALQMTSSSLIFYSIGMIGIGLREIMTRVFYSMNDSKTPVINATIGMVLNIVLNIILSKYLGIGGLALATSISAMFTTSLLFISFRKKMGMFSLKHISISFLKILFASLMMGLLAKLSFDLLSITISQNLSLLVAIVIGAVSYFVIIYFMKIEDVDVFVEAIKRKFGRRVA